MSSNYTLKHHNMFLLQRLYILMSLSHYFFQLKMNKVIADIFSEECNYNSLKSERRRAQYENLLINVFTRWTRQCNRINPFNCDTEHCVSKQVGWGELKCRTRTEDDATRSFGDDGFGAEGTKYADKWWMNYD